MPTNPLLAWVRDIFFRSIGKIPFVQEQFSEMRVKPQPRYTKGCLLPTKQAKLVGRLLPQPYVLHNGVRVRFDEVLGDNFVLLRFYQKPAEAFRALQDEEWMGLTIRFVCVQPQLGTGEVEKGQYDDNVFVRDCDGALATFLGYREDLFVLIRPDHYVMGEFHIEDAGGIRQAIYELLRGGKLRP